MVPATNAAATALTDDLVELAEELEQLGGGGDARVGRAQVICRVRPPAAADSVRVVSAEEPDGCVVHVRDPRCPDETPEAQAVRRFSVSPGGVLCGANDNGLHREQAEASAEALFETAGAGALEWLLEGFSSAVIASGESGSGKTFALFGPSGSPHPERYGLCPRLLHELYAAIEASRPKAAATGDADEPDDTSPTLTLALSLWEVRHNEVFDLLAAGKAGQQAAAAAANAAGGPHPYVLVEAPTLEAATRLLALGRSRSLNGGPASSRAAAAAALPARSSIFVRLALYDAARGSFASLYLVDLAGTAPLPSTSEANAAVTQMSAHSTVSGAELIAERRSLNRQLLAFHRVVAEVASLEPSSGKRLLSSRDSKLTQQLAPLLAGSCRTQLLACVRAEAEHFGETCATLRALCRAVGIRAACMRLGGIGRLQLGLLRADAVLPPLHPLPRPPAVSTGMAASLREARERLGANKEKRGRSPGGAASPPSTFDLQGVWETHALADKAAEAAAANAALELAYKESHDAAEREHRAAQADAASRREKSPLCSVDARAAAFRQAFWDTADEAEAAAAKAPGADEACAATESTAASLRLRGKGGDRDSSGSDGIGGAVFRHAAEQFAEETQGNGLSSPARAAVSSAQKARLAAEAADAAAAAAGSHGPGAPPSALLRDELEGMLSSIGQNAWSAPQPPGAPVDAWVTAELERRVEEQLALARGGGNGAPTARQKAQAQPNIIPEPPPIRSYAAQHISSRAGKPKSSPPLPTVSASPPARSHGASDVLFRQAAEQWAELAASSGNGHAEGVDADYLAAEAMAAEAEAIEAARGASVESAAAVAEVEAYRRAQVELEAVQAMADAQQIGRDAKAATAELAANTGQSLAEAAALSIEAAATDAAAVCRHPRAPILPRCPRPRRR